MMDDMGDTVVIGQEDVKDMMLALRKRFEFFKSFDVDSVAYYEGDRKRGEYALRLHAQKKPFRDWGGYPYAVEVFRAQWDELEPEKRALTAFRIMCMVPDQGFDAGSEYFCKIVKPDVVMFAQEVRACGGLLDWREASGVRDPFDEHEDPIPMESTVDRQPVRSDLATDRQPVTGEGLSEGIKQVAEKVEELAEASA